VHDLSVVRSPVLAVLDVLVVLAVRKLVEAASARQARREAIVSRRAAIRVRPEVSHRVRRLTEMRNLSVVAEAAPQP
jgi:hypothetical protein